MKLPYIYNVEVKSGSAFSTEVARLQALIGSEAEESLVMFYKFCLISLLKAYTSYLVEKVGINEDDFKMEVSSLTSEDLDANCTINGKLYSLSMKRSPEYTFDRGALIAKGLTLDDGTAVKDMTAYARYLEAKGLPVPNFIKVSTKTICSFDKKVAATCVGDPLVEVTTKTEIKL